MFDLKKSFPVLMWKEYGYVDKKRTYNSNECSVNLYP